MDYIVKPAMPAFCDIAEPLEKWFGYIMVFIQRKLGKPPSSLCCCRTASVGNRVYRLESSGK